MQRLQAYKFELMPNGEQMRLMRQFAGACRFIYNKALAWQNDQYAADNTFRFNAFKCNKEITAWKREPELAWLKLPNAQILQQTIGNLDRALKNFFAKRADFPKFKKKGVSDSFRFPQGFKIEQGNNRFYLPKIGWVRFRNSRAIEGVAKNITISIKNGKFYAAVQTERQVEDPIHSSSSMIGVDMGIAKFATLSNGEVFKPKNSFKVKSNRLARLQRAMSRKIKFSQNWKKAKRKVSKLHEVIANIRKDYLHKVSHAICKSHAIVVIENLKVKNMSATSKGDLENPGRNVKAKSGLNKSILDQGWFEFRRQLEYKQAWRGGEVIVVPPQFTSQQCSCCGHISRDNRQSQANFECVQCGHSMNADINAAKNILAAGHAVLACGEAESLSRSMKQESAEVMA